MNNIDDIIDKIKIYRSPEAFIDNLFIKSKIVYSIPNIIYYKFKNNIIFYYNPAYEKFYYDLEVYEILKDRYKCSNGQIRTIIFNKSNKSHIVNSVHLFNWNYMRFDE